MVKYNIPFKALSMLVCMKHSTRGCLVVNAAFGFASCNHSTLPSCCIFHTHSRRCFNYNIQCICLAQLSDRLAMDGSSKVMQLGFILHYWLINSLVSSMKLKSLNYNFWLWSFLQLLILTLGTCFSSAIPLARK